MRPYILIAVILLGLSSALLAEESELYEVDAAIIKAANLTIQSTVKITSDTLGHGSGFFVSVNEVLTSQHVIGNMGRISILTHDDRTCNAKLIYQDEKLDLALLSTDCSGEPLTLGTAYTVGQTVLAAGNPDIYNFIITKGIVSGEGWKHILFDAPITHGSSGGPLVNIEGTVIGVNTAVDSKIGFIGYAITGLEAIRFIERARR